MSRGRRSGCRSVRVVRPTRRSTVAVERRSSGRGRGAWLAFVFAAVVMVAGLRVLLRAPEREVADSADEPPMEQTVSKGIRESASDAPPIEEEAPAPAESKPASRFHPSLTAAELAFAEKTPNARFLRPESEWATADGWDYLRDLGDRLVAQIGILDGRPTYADVKPGVEFSVWQYPEAEVSIAIGDDGAKDGGEALTLDEAILLIDEAAQEAAAGEESGERDTGTVQTIAAETATLRAAAGTATKQDASPWARFPHQVRPGQRLTVTLTDLPRGETLLLRAFVPSLPNPDIGQARRDRRLTLSVNHHVVFDQWLPNHEYLVSAWVPQEWVRRGENEVEIACVGKQPLIFDAVWLERAEPNPEVYLTSRQRSGLLPDHRRYFAPREITPKAYSVLKRCRSVHGDFVWDRHYGFGRFLQASHRYMGADGAMRRPLGASPFTTGRHGRLALWSNKSDAVWQEEDGISLVDLIVGWYATGGEGLWLEELFGESRLFCPRTRRPYPNGHLVARLLDTFRGSPTRLPSNLYAAADTGAWYHHVAIQNSDSTVSVAVTPSVGNWADNHAVRLQLRLPWRGQAELTVTDGLYPTDQLVQISASRPSPGPREEVAFDRPREVRSSRVALGGENGDLFVGELDFTSFAVFRFQKPGTEPPALAEEETEPPVQLLRPLAARSVASVSSMPVPDDAATIPLRGSQVGLEPFSHLSVCRRSKATKGKVGDDEYTTPRDDDSLFVSFRYPEGCSLPPEAVRFKIDYQYKLRRDKALRFWVRPTVPEETDQTVRLGFVLGDRVFSVPVQTNRWQRVSLTLPVLNLRHSLQLPDQLLLFNPSRRSGRSPGDPVTFEFNGFAYVAVAQPEHVQ